MKKESVNALFADLFFKFTEFFGVCLVFAALVSFAALLSYCPEDLSFNTAIDGFVSNLVLSLGSYYSDAMMQFFGATSYLFSLILVSFGYQLIKYHSIAYYRFISSLICGISCSAFLYLIDFKQCGVVGMFIASYSFRHLEIEHEYYAPFFAFVFFVTFLISVRFHWSSFTNVISGIHFWITGKSKQLKEKSLPEINILNHSSENPGAILAASIPKKKQRTQVKSGSDFVMPSIHLLSEAKHNGEKLSENELKNRANNLLTVLSDFGINGEITGVSPGPVVTLYELMPAAGIKSSRVIGLSNDIARYMSAVSARVAVIPGKNALGIELPNVKRQTVYLREILESSVYSNSEAALPVSLGKDISGDPIVADLAKMPHLLIAGTTGSGKSVGINAMILSLLYRLPPEKCKFIMVDPKMLELSVYDDIPHLLVPVVTDPKKAVVALKWAVKEMESRYKSMSKLGVRNIEGYNAKLENLRKSGEDVVRKVHTGFDPDTGAPIYENQTMKMEPVPYIVIIVDEMADLMLVAGKDIEVAVQRLAQMARAAGIHLIMATQRPSVDVITGTIKANFPTRISFQVSSKIDSRTILGEQGAEQLLGQGDMLYMASGGRMTRIHCPFVSDSEVEKVTEALRAQGEPHYITDILQDDDEISEDDSEEAQNGDDPLYQEAVSLILREGKASTSFIQRHLKIGYNRAARIIDMMEAAGIVSPANHVGKREILNR